MEQGDRVGIWGPNSYEWYQTQVCPSCSVFTLVLKVTKVKQVFFLSFP